MPDERRYRLTDAAMQPQPGPGFLSGLDRRGGEHRTGGLAHLMLPTDIQQLDLISKG